jgi:uncharacterized membrane protein YeaQ/YmgE (transglycosylase-associated protein family)
VRKHDLFATMLRDKYSTSLDGFMLILAILVIGMMAGWLAHLLVESQNDTSWFRLLAVGIVGSFIGGAIGNSLVGGGFDLQLTGVVGSTVGAVMILGAMRILRTTS